MSKVKIELVAGAVPKILKSGEVAGFLADAAHRIAAAAGPGHVVESTIGPQRARSVVITDTFEARHAEATSHTLTAAIGAGRG